MSNRIQIPYTVPVEVVVDVDTGEVLRVVVIDEEIALEAAADGTVTVHDDSYQPVEDKAAAQAAVEIAESADWPAWDHGW